MHYIKYAIRNSFIEFKFFTNLLNMRILLLLFVTFTSFTFIADEDASAVEIGQTWQLTSRSNKASLSGSKVLYFFSSDAYHTYQARIFSDWDNFSIVDSRNLVRLNKGDRVQILKTKHNEKVYQVELLDGFEKNKKYFVIKDDLFNDFKLMEKK
tara:strand:- start:398 stop:859 length:462 start_codon:yes stop_codon:yes gene_type:complete